MFATPYASTFENPSGKSRSWVFTNNWARKDPVLNVDGSLKAYKITCLHPGCKVTYGNKDGSTGNIVKHLQDDHFLDNTVVNNPAFKQRQGPMDSIVLKGTKRTADPWSKKDFEDAYLKFLITSRSSFRLIKNPSLQHMLNLANGVPSKVFIQLPSDTTLSRKIADKFKELKNIIFDTLEGVPKVALTLDGWTDDYLKSFLGVTAHWIDERAFTSKNSQWSTFNAKHQHIPCLGHVINLAVQAFLGKNGLRATALKESVEHNDTDYKNDIEVLPAPDDFEETADEESDALVNTSTRASRNPNVDSKAEIADENEPRTPVTLLHTGISLDDTEIQAEHFDAEDGASMLCPLWTLRNGVIKLR
ncbi:hypothetical protein BGW38_003755 [Lunasporangiospora selenospora]|uniref:Uncharacterized protein n=1 Tax=Lunasporangiospora selenospora TaxID=979761 RepID=A0A9P6FQZ6_9FUNG|nr:hypothetical protein BGW38_003755 [Lunasporangiospora selenospora]